MYVCTLCLYYRYISIYIYITGMPSRRATGSQQRLERKVQGRTRLPRCPMISTSALHHPTYPLTYGPMVFCTDFSVHKIFLTAYDLMAKILHQFICGSLDIRGFDAYKIIQDFSCTITSVNHSHACVLATWFRLCCVQLHLSLTVASFLILACSLRWWHNPVWRTLPIGTCKNVRVFFCLSRWRELIDRFGVHEISVKDNGKLKKEVRK